MSNLVKAVKKHSVGKVDAELQNPETTFLQVMEGLAVSKPGRYGDTKTEDKIHAMLISAALRLSGHDQELFRDSPLLFQEVIITVDGLTYDFSTFQHPGGAAAIRKYHGKEMSSEKFLEIHGKPFNPAYFAQYLVPADPPLETDTS